MRAKNYIASIFLLTMLYLSTNAAYAQNENITPVVEDVEAELHDAMLRYNLEEAWMHVEALQNNDSLSNNAMLDIADCYIGLKKYQEVLSVLDGWVRKFPERELENILDYKYGEAYYFLGDNEKAAKLIEPYVIWCKDNGYSVGLFDLGIYADALFNILHNEKAIVAYKDFFQEAMVYEGLPFEQLYKGKLANSYGYKYYNFAYLNFYSGDEKTGKRMLELSVLCGNEDAKTDLEHLGKNPSFATEYKIKWRVQEEYDEIITKYDPKQYLADANIDTQDKFWKVVRAYSEGYQKLSAALQKENRKKTLSKALNDITDNASSMKNYLIMCQPYEKSDIETNIEKRLFGPVSPVYDFRIYPASDVNAFATPYGQIYLTSGIVLRYHFNNSLLTGVCAHEAAHYLLQHSLTQKWQELEKQRKNEIWGGVVAGLSVAAMAGAGLYAASNGVAYDDSYWDNVSKMGGYIVDGFNQDAFYFKFRYSRSQEIESDIIAYRFCETFGIGGYAYIMALQMLGDNDVYMRADSTSDHPTTNYRVNLLKYLYSKDHPRTNEN